jgi:carbonic anhydrase
MLCVRALLPRCRFGVLRRGNFSGPDGLSNGKPNAVDLMLERNEVWRKTILHDDPTFFERCAQKQSPEVLFIGCSDSRVSAEVILGAGVGELFVHRNIANVVINTDMSCLSVIQYAVTVLKVNHIIVCGHYECGGVKAALDGKPLGLIDNWLRNIQDVYRLHAPILDKLEGEEKMRRLVEKNTAESVLNLYKNAFVQQERALRGGPKIHGLVYDIKNGRLKRISVDIPTYLRKFSHIYTYEDGTGNRKPPSTE